MTNNWSLLWIYTDAEISWQMTEVTVDEGDNGEVMQGELCLVLDDRAGGLHRPVNVHLSSVIGTAGM